MICSNCGYKNGNTDIYCGNCGNKLYNNPNNNVVIIKNNEKAKQIPITSKVLNIIKIIMIIIVLFTVGPFLLIGIVMTGLGIYNGITQQQKISTYEQTTGEYIKQGECDTDGLCTGIYKYEINGITYEIESNTLTDELESTVEVYYDSTNPQNAIVKENTWAIFIIFGLIALVIVITEILFMVFIYKAIKRASEKNQHQVNNPKTL